MAMYGPSESDDHVTHGATFAAFVNSVRGSTELCAWRLSVPAGVVGVAHRPSRDEVLLVLDGALQVSVDGESRELTAGCVAHVPAGAELRIDTGAVGGGAWVTTSRGLSATMPDGATISPPWAQ